MADTFHPLEEFGDFPWDKIDPQEVEVEFECSDRQVIVIGDDTWEIPQHLTALLDHHMDYGEEKAKKRMRDSIGIQE